MSFVQDAHKRLYTGCVAIEKMLLHFDIFVIDSARMSQDAYMDMGDRTVQETESRTEVRSDKSNYVL